LNNKFGDTFEDFDENENNHESNLDKQKHDPMMTTTATKDSVPVHSQIINTKTHEEIQKEQAGNLQSEIRELTFQLKKFHISTFF